MSPEELLLKVDFITFISPLLYITPPNDSESLSLSEFFALILLNFEDFINEIVAFESLYIAPPSKADKKLKFEDVISDIVPSL